jgi:hypothetical protein
VNKEHPTPTPEPEPNTEPTSPIPKGQGDPRRASAGAEAHGTSYGPTAVVPGVLASAAARVARGVLGAAGVGLGLWGLRLLLQAVSTDALIRLPLWLGGAVVTDDFFLVPLTVAAGWLLTRWSMGPGRHRIVGVVRTTLL